MSETTAVDRANAYYEQNNVPINDAAGYAPSAASSSGAAAAGASGGSWLDQLQPASWRGVPFAVRESSIRRGRKTAQHDYPYRDDVWVEDLGRKARQLSFRGFVVGDDCYQQRDNMVAAAEQAGPGEIVHPSLGSRNAVLIDFEASERAEEGRVVELSFTFVESTGLAVYPDDSTSTQDAVDSDADDCDAAAGTDFVSDVTSALAEGTAVVQGALDTVQGFANQVTGLAGDATMALHAVNALPGNFGRFAFGSVSTPLAPTATVSSVLSAATTARTAVTTAATAAENLAEAL